MVRNSLVKCWISIGVYLFSCLFVFSLWESSVINKNIQIAHIANHNRFRFRNAMAAIGSTLVVHRKVEGIPNEAYPLVFKCSNTKNICRCRKICPPKTQQMRINKIILQFDLNLCAFTHKYTFIEYSCGSIVFISN